MTREKTATPSILSNLGLNRFERAIGILLIAFVVGGLTLEKITVSEAATMLVALTGVAAALSTARKTGAEAADAYASAAQKSAESMTDCMDIKKGLEAEINELRDSLEKLKKQNTLKDKRLVELQEQNERLRQRLDEKDKAISILENQIATFMRTMEQKDTRIADLEKLASSQTEKMAAQAQEIASLRREIEQLK